MTLDQKKLAFDLLKPEFYLRKKSDPKKKYDYMLYTGNQTPVRYISDSAIKKLKKLDLLKTDRHQKITLNLSKVRQLHGKSYLKRTYKLLNIKL